MFKFYITYKIKSHYLVYALIIIALLAGCAKVDGPKNLEPTLKILEASNITRNTATVSVEIDNPGTATFSLIRFHYDNQTTALETKDIIPISDKVEIELTGLIAGRTYTYYAEGVTSGVTIRSESQTFTTVPNDIPTVTKAIPLSTGPTGIIIEFSIDDDGGEKIINAGCEVTDINNNSFSKLYLSEENIEKGKHRMVINGLTPETSYKIVTFASNSSGENNGEEVVYTTRNGIIIREPGVLKSLFTDGQINLKALTISGDLNSSDFNFLRKIVGAPSNNGDEPVISNVTELFLSDVNIVEGGIPFDGSRFTEANTVSTGLFADCSQLETIILPNSTTKIKRDAFSNSSKLESINIPLEVSELTPSLNCKSLKSIHVSESNKYFSEYNGVVLNKAGNSIIWFPEGKTGYFKLPSTITTIGKNAFSGTHITSLDIPESVTNIENGAFYGSSLQEIKLPDNMTNVAQGLFQNCASLHTVKLGTSTEIIGNYAFDNTSLTQLYVGATLPPYIYTDTFTNNLYSIFDNCILFVPKGTKSLYRNHNKWNQFKQIEEY